MKKPPSVHHTVIFVRHGQYEREPERLTKLGLEQAACAARELFDVRPDHLFCSTMPRAIETAEILAQGWQHQPVRKKFFSEALLPVPSASFGRIYEERKGDFTKAGLRAVMRKNARQADQAFRFLFGKAPRSNRLTVVVAHGNVIRYWACRALGIDPRKWLLMDVLQCSFTTIQQSRSGGFQLLGLSDCRHIPRVQRTFM